jgi:hypothetical protein
MRIAVCALVVSFGQLGAQQPRLTISPARPLPGALVTLTSPGLGDRADSIVAIAGTMAGEPLHFVPTRTGHRALGAVPVDSVNTVEAAVVVTRASGRSDTLHASSPAAAAAAEGAAAGGVAVRPQARQRDRSARGARGSARARRRAVARTTRRRAGRRPSCVRARRT